MNPEKLREEKVSLPEKILKPLIEKWEIGDFLPKDKVDAVVGMSIGQMEDGSVGSALKPIIEGSAEASKKFQADYIIFSNRFEKNDIILSELMKDTAVNQFDTSSDKIITADEEKNKLIRNTFTEADFTIQTCKEKGIKSLLIVANHIHMRRVIDAYLKVMKKNNYRVHLYWQSVGYDGYGENASSQTRFESPGKFFGYEMLLAAPISAILKWSKPWRMLKRRDDNKTK